MTRSLEDTLHEQVGAIVRTARDGLDLLRGEVPTTDTKIQAVVHSVREALLSVEQLLAGWSRALKTREHAAEAMLPCHLLSHTENVRCAVEDVCRQHGVRIDIAAAPSLPSVAGMPERITLVCLTLLEYAIRLATRDSIIRIALTETPFQQGSGVEWRVTANAASFSERDRYHLFEALGTAPGTRASSERGRPGDTLLQRLATCRQLVDSMGGAVWVERGADGSVAFVLVLPAVQALPGSPAPRTKLDIVVRDGMAVAAAVGVDVWRAHVQALETAVRGAVRHPRDTVMEFSARGLIGVLLQTDASSAAVVIERIRHAIAARGLHTIGATTIIYDFRVAGVS